jgi:DNA primase
VDIKNVILSIKQNINAIDLIGETVTLKKSGTSWVGFCPFHVNKNTPAFVVWNDGHWKCFGECDSHGDVIDFYMRVNHVDLLTCLEELAKKAGVKFERTEDSLEIQRKKNLYYQIVERACQYYQEQLKIQPEAEAFYARRGIKPESIRRFRLGYASANVPDGMVKHLLQHFQLEDIVGAGMVHKDEKTQKVYDCYFDRTIFPIQDISNRVLGFGARTMTNKMPKYINTTTTLIFDKGASLYGINTAIHAIRKSGVAVIVEGFIDALLLQQEGFENSVAVMGVSLSEKQIKLIGRSSIVLALDSDKAGQQGVLRNIIRVGNQSQITIAMLPEGKDPDEIVLESQQIWGDLISKVQPVARFAIDLVLAKIDIDNHQSKSDAARTLLPLIGDISDPIIRDGYIQELSKKLKVSATVLSNSARKPILDVSPQETHEDIILGTLVKYPHAVWLVDRKLREHGLAPFNENDFTDSLLKSVAKLVRESVEQIDYDADEYVRMNMDVLAEDFSEKLTAANCAGSESEAEKLLYNIVVRMRIRQLDAEIEKIAFMEGEDIAGILSASLKKKSNLNKALE